tara:strand:- start:4944 stop:6680 length:1737 start_codon:yes stop_codon:yes gene_type:complete
MKNKPTIVLGLNDSNSAAALIKDGKLVAHAREERFNRIKFSDDYPTQAVEYCLSEAGVTIKDVDHIVFGWNPGHELEPQDSAAAIRHHKDFLHYIPNNLLRHVRGPKENKRIASISQQIDFQGDGEINLHFAPHHACHAASTFLVSPFKQAAILTIDAYGDDITTRLSVGKDNKITTISDTLYPHSMGQVYAAVTQYLGYRANSDEWKVMGLSPYGNQTYYNKFKKLIRFDADLGQLRFDLDYFMFFTWHPRRYSDQFISMFGPERQPYEPLTKKHQDIAASFQRRVEDVIIEMCEWAHQKTGLSSLCLAGGVTMNSKMNGRILRETSFENIYIAPSADDGGVSLGACFYYWNHVLGNERSFEMTHDYWGPGFSNDEIKAALDDSLVKYEYLVDPTKEAAKSLTEGKIICWFQDRMESGNRALGNRSILGDPRDPEMKNKINKLVKHREAYRPFAPSILEECQSEYFESDYAAPFMQMVHIIKEEKREEIPAVTHIDGSGRLQTVQKEVNPKYWNLIKEFRNLTGTGLVLNTSFNDNDEPIVCTPKQAIRTFFGTGLHELYMGNYRIVKETTIYRTEE